MPRIWWRSSPNEKTLARGTVILGVLSGIATIITFLDNYLFHSKLAEALHVPSTVPTALALAFVSLALVLAFVQAGQATLHASDATQAKLKLDRVAEELDQLRGELKKEKERAAKAETLLQESLDRTSLAISLRKQVLAVLTSRSRDEREIQSALGIDFVNTKSQVLLREALGDLVTEGLIQRQRNTSGYELKDRLQEP